MPEEKLDTAIYDPGVEPDEDGVAFCPLCKSEMDQGRDTTGEGWWYCIKCRNWIVTQPSHHEGTFLGHSTVLLRRDDRGGVGFDTVEHPGGFLQPYCPRCKKPMWVQKLWWDRSEVGPDDRCRLVLGYVCEDWKGCGYTQSLKALVPREVFDYLKE